MAPVQGLGVIKFEVVRICSISLENLCLINF